MSASRPEISRHHRVPCERGGELMSENIDVTLLHEILEQAITGQESKVVCPLCGQETFEKVDMDEFQIRFECRSCHRYVEVPLAQ